VKIVAEIFESIQPVQHEVSRAVFGRYETVTAPCQCGGEGEKDLTRRFVQSYVMLSLHSSSQHIEAWRHAEDKQSTILHRVNSAAGVASPCSSVVRSCSAADTSTVLVSPRSECPFFKIVQQCLFFTSYIYTLHKRMRAVLLIRLGGYWIRIEYYYCTGGVQTFGCYN
jgi:hypothetical protein